MYRLSIFVSHSVAISVETNRGLKAGFSSSNSKPHIALSVVGFDYPKFDIPAAFSDHHVSAHTSPSLGSGSHGDSPINQNSGRLVKMLRQVSSKYNIFTSIGLKERKSVAGGVLANTVAALKDNLTTRDAPTTCSSKILQDYVSPFDSTVARLLTKESTHIVGKTNMDEFGMGNSSLNSNLGPTLNPLYRQSTDIVEYEEKTFWTKGNDINEHTVFENPQSPQYTEHRYLVPRLKDSYQIDPEMRIVGGSSGGSAAAVAADLVDFAIGTDTGGSVRLPSCYTSIYGYKPSYGRISRWGLVSYAQSLDTVGIMSKNLDILSNVFKVLDHHDSSDPTSISETQRSRNETLGAKIKLGVPLEMNLPGLDATIKEKWHSLLQKLQESDNIELHTVSIPSLVSCLPAYYTLVTSEASSNLARFDGIRYGFRSNEQTSQEPEFTTTRSNGFGSEVKRRIILGSYSLSSYGYSSHFMNANGVRKTLINELNNVFKDPHMLDGAANPEGVDFLLCPTATSLPPLVSEYQSIKPVESYMNDVLTVPFSLAGLPVLNIPYGKSIGFQLAGQMGQDYKVLKFAQLMQQLDRKNWTTVAKNSPKSPKMPKLSTMKPQNEYFISMRNTPNRKQMDPLNFCGLVKKYTVFWGPIMRTNPITKSRLLIARRAESKKVNTPKKNSSTPPAVNPTPNSKGQHLK
ncbi:hypothetical protein OGAPHI_000461 [Ogataea philodendri]|uniref:Glutamyl-tRNA(Gln) amidotransferase subunit A, mitochondrial n=1 Tax=Ogataea philodendri TaxID=1378263 RepID=A0A9P8PGY0_9ASCO|nr:uncharacterized protein OGAPHI_000461 [Ogataea philodendri]KAH3671756.1 hypothetical protein OGAPHI_000461 [Ogataea philodendri]